MGFRDEEIYKSPSVFTINGKDYHVKKDNFNRAIRHFVLREKHEGFGLMLQFERPGKLENALNDAYHEANNEIVKKSFNGYLYSNHGYMQQVTVVVDGDKNKLKMND